jgi:hypothetical protein
MTKQQLSQWQCEARKKRKAIKQRENRMRKKAMLDQMKKELVELNRRLEEKKRKTEARTSDAKKAKQTLPVTSGDSTVTAPIQGIEQVKNSRRKEDILVADPFIENDVDAAASWFDDDQTLASADEIANVFDM